MSSLRMMAVVAVSLILVGCNAVPVVEYSKIDDTHPPKGVTDTFYFAQSQITLNKTVAENEKTKKKTEEYTIVSKPVAFDDYKIGVRPHDSLRVSTKINIAKIENTDLVSSIGVETTDNTIALINQVGGAVVKVAGLMAAAAPAAPGSKPPSIPCIADDEFPVQLTLTSDQLNVGKAMFDKNGDKSEAGCIQVTIERLPQDVTPAAYIFDKQTSNYYYSACREATVSFMQGGKKAISKKIRIADPSHLQAVQLPFKGSITMHSACGVSVKTDSTSPQNAVSIVDALATQGKAIKDALDAAAK